MVSKSKIENMLTEAYNNNSFDYLGLCDGGNYGQVVYDSKDEESWKEVCFDKASAVEFAQKIIKGEK